jgi:putative endonuclease
MDAKYKKMLSIMSQKEVRQRKKGGQWSLYILKCKDGTLYTGITTDIEKRLQMHNKGRGARYTRSRRPVELFYQEDCGSRTRALVRECAVKSLAKKDKAKLASDQ